MDGYTNAQKEHMTEEEFKKKAPAEHVKAFEDYEKRQKK